MPTLGQSAELPQIAMDDSWPAWLEMWLLAIGIYMLLKVTSWTEAAGFKASLFRSAGYLLAWPGMDARSFLFGKEVEKPLSGEWLFAAVKLGIGIILAIVVIRLENLHPFVRGWVGMISLAFLLHFGIFHLLSCCWRQLGIPAATIMQWPIAACSVSEFWGRRWNLAFRDLTHRFLFRPLLPRLGHVGALLIGFLFSGIIHDVVISIPARGGYGGPTLFFLLQGMAILLERSSWGKKAGLGRGYTGWVFTVGTLMLPVPLLFHEPFRARVVLPFFAALGELR